MAKPCASPPRTQNAARIVASSSTSSGTEERTETRPEPNVRAPPSSSRISGLMSPYSGRGASSMTISTSPSTPSSARSSSCGASKPRSWPRWPSAAAMTSISRTVPVPVVNAVSIASEPGRYRRSTSNAPVGRIDQCPASGSSSRAKSAPLS